VNPYSRLYGDEFTNYLSSILKTFDFEPDIDNAYRNYIKWNEGKL